MKQNASFALFGSREEIPCGCRAEPANPCRQAIPPPGALRTQPSKPNGLRSTAARRTPNPTKQVKRLAPLPPDGCCLCTVFACMRNFPVRCISAAVSGAFFLSGIPRCRKRRGENANPRTNFIFLQKTAHFLARLCGAGERQRLKCGKRTSENIRARDGYGKVRTRTETGKKHL